MVAPAPWGAYGLRVVGDRLEWVLLAYRLPREPSTPRIALWRKLRRLGVAQVVDGLVAVPADARTREAVGWLADEVEAAGGQAFVWLGTLDSVAQEQALVERMSVAIGQEYREVMVRASAAAADSTVDRQRVVARLRQELRRVGQRDFFPAPERELARAAVERLAGVGVSA